MRYNKAIFELALIPVLRRIKGATCGVDRLKGGVFMDFSRYFLRIFRN